MKVSGAIPCYNGSQFIRQATESLLQQVDPLEEIIIVDDGSTDSSAEIIADLCSQNHVLKCITHEKNRGLPQARNSALHQAVGEIIFYLDVDAVADPYFTHHLKPEFNGSKVAGVGGAAYEKRSDGQANYWRHRFRPQNFGAQRSGHPPFLFGICSSYRVSIIKELGGFDPFFMTNGEDVDIGIRLRKAGYQLVYQPLCQASHHRDDTFSSLKKMVYRWSCWGVLAHMKNKAPYLKSHIFGPLKLSILNFFYSARRCQGRMMLFHVVLFAMMMKGIGAGWKTYLQTAPTWKKHGPE
ncbi:glycosyltransferase [candidate division CSSED10-310 bacterium]|uniref:Glycosyltransferase n=1 Tax=candidate division CSSED10-310 bacterium TaxID=2855610 RepID=A0ABV6YRV8_UNCC1